ncbi:MAG TPA: 50S ribosomal protein L13 [candidate division Zixibacteria bacterium]|nr:50S ribosomal protein L13 [candidate division Zixibacteria bacterium]
MKSPTPNKELIEHKWWVIDAEGLILGRMATKVARIIRGKEKPIYTPHLDTGDHVIVVNAEKIKVTGNKLETNVHKRFSGYPSGQRQTKWATVLEKNPERLVEHAVKGMLPKNRLGRRLFKKLHVYAGPQHPHQAQMPEALTIE